MLWAYQIMDYIANCLHWICCFHDNSQCWIHGQLHISQLWLTGQIPVLETLPATHIAAMAHWTDPSVGDIASCTYRSYGSLDKSQCWRHCQLHISQLWLTGQIPVLETLPATHIAAMAYWTNPSIEDNCRTGSIPDWPSLRLTIGTSHQQVHPPMSRKQGNRYTSTDLSSNYFVS